jgi:uncharacterized membrane protein
MAQPRTATVSYPLSAGILLGLGLGGFVDGIVLHQLLQWHHIATSAGYPPDSVPNLEFNTLLDGLFHAATWILTAAGLFLLWRAARQPHERWPAGLLAGSVLIGFGIFNLVEGLVNHQLLGLHHVNETAPPEHWIYWDLAFLASGAILLLIGSLIYRPARKSIA